ADHVVFGTVLLPGTAFIELALLAAQRVELACVEELTHEAPLALPPKGSVLIQLSVGPLNEAGRRSFTLHARPEDAPSEVPWTRHASGTLGPAVESAPFDLCAWPPPEATPLSLDGLYDRLVDAGLRYGQSFRGLSAFWKRENDLFAEVHLPDAPAHEA